MLATDLRIYFAQVVTGLKLHFLPICMAETHLFSLKVFVGQSCVRLYYYLW